MCPSLKVYMILTYPQISPNYALHLIPFSLAAHPPTSLHRYHHPPGLHRPTHFLRNPRPDDRFARKVWLARCVHSTRAPVCCTNPELARAQERAMANGVCATTCRGGTGMEQGEGQVGVRGSTRTSATCKSSKRCGRCEQLLMKILLPLDELTSGFAASNCCVYPDSI